VSKPRALIQPLQSDVPVLLLPVRLETRFIDTAQGPQLWLRVYPDQISINAHNPVLTTAEIQAGRAYWTAAWHASRNRGGDPAAPWRSLATRYRPQRAAWIARQTRPANYQPETATFDPAQPLVFPPPQTLLAQPQPTVAALPDSWTAFLWDGSTAFPQVVPFTNPIAANLTVAPNPQASASAGPAAVAIDSAARWMVDFTDAVTQGMAAQIPITPAQRQTGFTTIIVLGLRTEMPQQGATDLQDLLDAHHYSDGLAFVPQGTPTKNTPDASAGYSRQDPGGEISYATEAAAPLTAPPADPSVQLDGRAALSWLGLGTTDVFDHVQYANGLDQQDAYDMAVALWPVTLGYYLRQLMGMQSAPQLAAVESIRTYFITYVRARGPIPALRVGETPYGVVPVTSLSLWQSEFVRQSNPIARWLQAALPTWVQSYAATPRVAGTNDPDADMVGILGMDASATSYQGRYALGAQFVWNTIQWFGASNDPAYAWMQDNQEPAATLWSNLGLNALLPNPPIMQTAYEPDSWPVPGPIVQTSPVSETDSGPAPNYINWLLDAASIDDLQNENYPANPGPPPTALLYQLLRQSLILEYVHSADDVLLSRNLITARDVAEAEMVNFPSAPAPTKTPWDRLNTPVRGFGRAGQGIGDYMKDLERTPALLAGRFPRLDALRTSLARLAARPTAKLERVLSETLDVCSHRLDAWITSAATMLLSGVRADAQTASGVYLGGYGWVQNLTPAPQAQAGAPLTADEQNLVAGLDAAHAAAMPGAAPLPTVQPPATDNGGFIHAPSAAQGATAAILRTGYMTHQQSTDGQSLAVDLSSDRARTALWYLDGVRQGQSLSALLGYRFEAGLLADPALAAYIQPFRDRYPLVANKLTPPPSPSTPTESLAAPNVVDGLALQRDWAAGTMAWGSPLPAPGSSDQQGVIAVLQAITDVMDAIGDVSLAESVYQITRGNPGRAGGLLAAVSQGQRPPEVQVLDTPRGGLSLTHRLLVLFPGQPPASPPWQSGAGNPRAQAEPWLDAWLRTLLPDPATVKAWVQYDPGPPEPPTPPAVEVTLADLGVGPLDLLAMSTTADTAQTSELEQRVLYQAYRANLLPPGAGTPQVTFNGVLNRTQEASVPDLLVAVRAVRDMLAGARALAPADLAVPGASPSPVDTVDIHNRVAAAAAAATAAVASIQSALGNLAGAIASPGSGDPHALAQPLRVALLQASWFGIPGSVPPGPTAAGSAVSNVSVALDSTGTTYTVSFQTSAGGALAQADGNTITLLAAPGTAFSAQAADYTVNGRAVAVSPRLNRSGVVLAVPADVAAASVVTVTAQHVANLPAGTYTLSVLTSADTLASASAPYSITGASGTSVTNLSTAVSAPTAGATAQYTIGFTTSTSGALAGAAGTITLLATPGTIFSAQPGDYNVNGQASPGPVQVANGGRVTLTVPANIAAGAPVTVIASNVTNPGAHAYTLATGLINPGAGTYTLAVATSADPVAACAGAGYALGPLPALMTQGTAVASALAARAALPGAVTVQTVTLTTPSTYTIGFTTSAAGALSGTAGTLTLLAPPGTTFSQSAGDYTINGKPVRLPPQVDGASVTLTVPADIAAAAPVTVTAQNATNPAAGTYALSVLTSADPLAAASPAYTIAGAGTGPAAVAVALDQAGTTYTVSFNTSAGGALSPAHGDTITLLAPPGTAFSSLAADYTVNGQPVQSVPAIAPAAAQIPVPAAIAGGAAVTLVASNVGGPNAGAYVLSVTTSADVLAAVSSSYTIPQTAADLTGSLQTLFGRAFVPLPRFVAPNGADLDGAFGDTAQLLGGDATAPYRWLQQLTHVRPAVSRADMVASLAQVLAAAPRPGVVIGQLPRLPNDHWLALPLSSGVSGVTVAVNPRGAGAAGATYSVTFSTSAAGALAGGAGTITLTAPAGTTLPASGYTVTTPGADSATVGAVTLGTWPAGGASQNQAVLSLSASTIAAGDTVTVTIPGATNPTPAADYAMAVFTSADPQPVLSAPYTITGTVPGTAAAPAGQSRISLVAITGAGYDPTAAPIAGASVCGLLLDQWPEQIPNQVESTALVFHAAEPTARAPQVLLLAVNSSGAATWTDQNYNALLTILQETLDLAKVRTVDLASLANGGQFLPALFVAFNLQNDTVSSNWPQIPPLTPRME
jgi:hypothetical protein